MLNYCTSKLPIAELHFTFNREDVEFELQRQQQNAKRLESEYGLGGRNYLDYHKSGELAQAKMLTYVLSSHLAAPQVLTGTEPLHQRMNEVIYAIPQQPQRQDALADQLAALQIVANRLGLYDAAAHLRYRSK